MTKLRTLWKFFPGPFWKDYGQLLEYIAFVMQLAPDRRKETLDSGQVCKYK